MNLDNLSDYFVIGFKLYYIGVSDVGVSFYVYFHWLIKRLLGLIGQNIGRRGRHAGRKKAVKQTL